MDWRSILEYEPRVGELYKEAILLKEKEAKTPNLEGNPAARVAAHIQGDCFCKIRTWREKFKPQLDKLLGSDVALRGGSPLDSPVVYEIAYEKFCETLPPCRNCEHNDAVRAAYERGEIKELRPCLGDR